MKTIFFSSKRSHKNFIIVLAKVKNDNRQTIRTNAICIWSFDTWHYNDQDIIMFTRWMNRRNIFPQLRHRSLPAEMILRQMVLCCHPGRKRS